MSKDLFSYTGVCRFCGQMKTIQSAHVWPEHVIDEEVTRQCDCTEALELVAEEAAELAQACLKLSRILRGENPTPVPEVIAAEKVMEEAADVQTALNVLSSAQWYNEDYVLNIQWRKSERWKERLRKREEGNGQDGNGQDGDNEKAD